ncbi:TerD family protein [Neobacillus drentensis]
MDWYAPSHIDIDVSAFLLGHDEKIVREKDFVYYGQPSSSNFSVKFDKSMSTIENQQFIINFPNIPYDVQIISFALTICDSEINGYSFEEVSKIHLRIVNGRSQDEMAVFPIDNSFSKESAVVLGTLYRYAGEWKFHAVGARFYGGLTDLCDTYGVEVDVRPNTQSQNETLTNPTLVSPTQHTKTIRNKKDQLLIL